MSEKPGGKQGEDSGESIYDEATRLGAESLARKSGKSVGQVLEEARVASQEQHSATKVGLLKKENIEESGDNFDRTYKKAQNKNKGS